MAVTVSLTSTKIDITSTGGVQATLEEVYQAVIAVDATRMTRTGTGTSADPYVYQLIPGTGAAYVELEISSGCKVLFQNSGSNYSRLEWTWGSTTVATYMLDFASNSEVEIEPGFIFDLDATSASHYAYIILRGQINAVGTLGNEIIFKHYRNLYFYPYAGTHTFEYVKFMDTTYSSGYMFYMTYLQAASPVTVSMKHITVMNTSNTWGRIYINYVSTPPTDWALEDWRIEKVYYPLYTTASTVRLVRWYFKDTSVQAIVYGCGTGSPPPVITTKSDSSPTKDFQPAFIFEGCTFDNTDLGNIAAYCYYPGRIIFMSPTFIGLNYGAYSAYSSLVCWHGTITMASGTKKVWSTEGRHVTVRQVGITVKDLNGDPIEGAVVSIQQSEMKEWYSATTNADGEVLNIFDMKPFFIEKEETSNGVFVNWSDSIADGRYHEFVATADGYSSETAKYEITQDRDIVITLTPKNTGATVINNATINNSTIY